MEKVIFSLVILVGLLWGVWRIILFLRQVLAPVRAAIEPEVKVFDDNLKTALRRSGMGKIADISERLDKGIASALSEGQRRIDERNKP